MESHSFTKLIPNAATGSMTTVVVGNQTLKVQVNGNVRSFDERTRMFTATVSKFSPLAAEARKASGWFE